MTGQLTETIDLTPSPRILEMIAEVDLKPYQCLAELIDNAFDELRKASLEHPDWEPRVDVTVPTASKADREASVTVTDNGRGMTKDQMEEALSAGASGNSRFGSLGLFGMGFNVATARLGTLTTVRSGQAGDDHWTVVKIDLASMKNSKSFVVPVTREPKDEHEHGTQVTVTGLRSDVVGRLQASGEVGSIRRSLGRIYSYMLRDVDHHVSGASIMGGLGMGLYVNNKRVKAVWPCIWDPSRSVPYMGQDIPAVQQVDIALTPAWACMDCGHWHTYKPDTCTECGSTRVEERERRIWGWMGVQRFIDQSDFGFSIFRQGRSIVTQDKGLFDWESPEGDRVLEYPAELGQGRIVGEIHIDHAPVNFRKTDFDRSSNAWLYMVSRLRGEAPLKPQIAKRLGYQPNTSPLAALFNAYRRHDPGLRYLIPGDGEKSLHAQAKKWAEEFRNGTPGYESDKRWYEAARRHTEIASGHDSPTEDDPPGGEDDWFQRQGLDNPEPNPNDDEEPVPQPEPEPAPETEDQRISRYKEHARPLPELDGSLRVGNTPAQVRAYVTEGVDLLRDGIVGAPYTRRVNHGVLEVFLDARHPLMRVYGWSAFDVAVLCSAPELLRLYSYPGSLDELIVELFAQFPDQEVTLAAVRSKAESLLDQMRETVAPLVAERPDVHWNALSPTSRRATEEVASRAQPEISWTDTVADGGYSPYLTVAGIRDMLVAHPDDLLDGRVFRSKYGSWLNDDTRQGIVNRIAVLLDDLQVVLSPAPPSSPRELIRLRMSADILAGELARP